MHFAALDPAKVQYLDCFVFNSFNTSRLTYVQPPLFSALNLRLKACREAALPPTAAAPMNPLPPYHDNAPYTSPLAAGAPGSAPDSFIAGPLSPGVIAGIVIAAMVVIAIFVGAAVFILRRSHHARDEVRPLLHVQDLPPPAASEPKLSDSHFAEAIIFEKLGSGGSGMEIFRCTVGGLTCAVKIMDLSLFDEKQEAEFVQEIELLIEASNRSQFVVKYLHHIHTHHECKLFMEYFPTTLQNQIAMLRKEKRGFSKQAVSGVCRRVLRGLDALHGASGAGSKRILHRDLKSANVFAAFDRFGNVIDVKIGDFGISKLVATSGPGGAQTFVGTPGFMAPEVLKSKPYSTAADIWSFGAMLYEMLALQAPFAEVSWDSDREKRVMDGEMPDFSSIDGQLELFLPALRECFSLDPSKRPTASELLQRPEFQ